MKTSEILDLINEIETGYRVDRWTCDGVRVWPFIRIRLAYDLLYYYRMKITDTGLRPSLLSRRALSLLRDRLAYAAAVWKDFRQNAKPSKQTDVLFFSDGISYSLMHGVWFEKFCDPLIAILKEDRLTSFLVSPLNAYHVPRHTPSLFVQPRIDTIKARRLLFPGRGPISAELLEDLPSCTNLLLSRSVPARLMDMRTIRHYSGTISDIASMYDVILDRLKPSLAFLVGYYSVEGMGAVLASRRRGIPVIDLQHGSQGPLHAAYARWSRVPATGYELLPSYFWCWSERDVASIRQWSSPVDDFHHPLLGGNTWMELWKRGGRLTEDYDKTVLNAMALHPRSKHILVTLQPGMSDVTSLAPLLTTAKVNGSSWHWWIRLHPGMLKDRSAITTMFSRHGVKNITLDLATDLPLYALLRHLHVHVTLSSSTVLECQQFGIPTVIISKFGAELFSDQIKSRWAVASFTSEEITEAIHTILKDKPRAGSGASAPQKSPSEHAKAAIGSILRHARRSFSSSQSYRTFGWTE